MKIVAISDTHVQHKGIIVPDGDVLVCSGDVTGRGFLSQFKDFAEWFGAHPHPYKIFVAGNHDWNFIDEPAESKEICRDNGIIYLEDDEVMIRGRKFYGSPWQPEFCSWAFNLPRGEKLKEKWDMIPDDTDVLITHGPPRNVRDEVHHPDQEPTNEGCDDLRDAVFNRVKPLVHIFGHIHENPGKHVEHNIVFANAAQLDGRYRRKERAPIIIELDGLQKQNKTSKIKLPSFNEDD